MSEREHELDAAVAAAGHLISAGSVEIPTGRIIACDPYFAVDAAPFERTVEPGSYSLELGRVRTELFGERTAFARLRLRPDAVVVRSERAGTGGAGWDAYPVDTGLGSFMDEHARDEFLAAMKRYETENPDADYDLDILEPDLRRSAPAPGRPGIWAIHQPPGTNVQVAIFRSGLGDGFYRSYWGLDAAGEPVTLVTDFEVVD